MRTGTAVRHHPGMPPSRSRAHPAHTAPSQGQFVEASRAYRVSTFLGLPPPDPTALGLSAEVAELLRKAAEVYARAITTETRHSYANRWAHFQGWCDREGHQALPTAGDTLILYIQSLVEGPEEFSISTARGRVAAIARVNVEAGYQSTARDPAVSTYMRALSRTIGPATRRRPVKALKTADLRHTILAIPDEDARAVRDRALIALHAMGLSAQEIAAIRLDDVVIKKSGMWIQRGTGDPIKVVDASGVPARSAVMAWRALAVGGPDQMFTTTDQYGHRSLAKVSAADVTRTIERRMAGLGLSAEGNRDVASAMALLSRPNGLSLRDRALLTVGFAAAMRRVDVTLLRWRDVIDDPEGVLIYLAYSKTDRDGKGRTIAIPYGRNPRTCPVSALLAWRDYVAQQVPAADMSDQHVFVTIGRSGRLGAGRMCSSAVTEVVVRRTAEASLEGPWGGRSLRAGLITSAVELDIPLEEIAHQSGHKTIENLLRYVRRDDPFARNPASKVGL